MKLAKKITTAAALAAALLAGTAPKAAAQCPYTVGPLGRYIAPAIVQGMTATDDGAVEVWCTDALDGDDWYFLVDAETDLRIYDRVDLVVDANGTPEDFSAGTVPAVGVPASRLALAVLHPGRFWTFAGWVRFST